MLILQVLPNLAGGGAERVAINLSTSWASSGHQVEFLLMELRGELLKTLSKNVIVHELNCERFRQSPLPLARFLRQRQPDVTLVHMWPLTSAAVLAWRLAGKPGKLFICEHTALSEHVKRDSMPLAMVQLALRLTHRTATGVVTVSTGVAKDLAQLAGMSVQRVEVIHNPVVAAELAGPSQQPDIQILNNLWRGLFRTHLVSVGSLSARKNYQLLLQAFAHVAPELDAALVILGEGNLRAILEQQVYELGLQGRVVMPGFHADPTPWYQAADLFVLSSDYEGLPTVLIEALACGTPVVSTDCPHGPAEILEQGRYGELVPVGDVFALSDGIRRALSRPWNREALQRRAQDFSIPKQAQAYLDLFYRL